MVAKIVQREKTKRHPLHQAAKVRPSKGVAVARKFKNTGTMAAAASVSADKPLTDKQRAFAKLWAAGHPLLVAYASAGYSIHNQSLPYRMAKMPNILALYNEEKRRYEEASQMTRKKVMEMLQESYDMAKLMSEPASMVSAAREIGKMCGYYEPRKVSVEVTHNGQVVMQRMNQLSDADLLRIIESGGQSLDSDLPLLEE